MRELAVYKGDEMLVMGTVQECAETLGVVPDTVRYYTYPSYQERIKERQARGYGEDVRVAFWLEEDEDECEDASYAQAN